MNNRKIVIKCCIKAHLIQWKPIVDNEHITRGNWNICILFFRKKVIVSWRAKMTEEKCQKPRKNYFNQSHKKSQWKFIRFGFLKIIKDRDLRKKKAPQMPISKAPDDDEFVPVWSDSKNNRYLSRWNSQVKMLVERVIAKSIFNRPDALSVIKCPM